MSDVPFQERVTALEAAIRPEGGQGGAPPATLPELANLKGWLDDVRLNLWGKLQAAQQPESADFEERFRVQRAIDICQRLTTDLQAGRTNPHHGEFSLLVVAVAELTAAIQAGRIRRPPAPPAQ
jgi:hypothetical protein